MRYLLMALCLALPGCAAVFDGPQPARLVDDLPPGIGGRASWSGNICAVLIRRETYPRCLTHEWRHCFEGPFHGDKPSDESCYVSQ